MNTERLNFLNFWSDTEEPFGNKNDYINTQENMDKNIIIDTPDNSLGNKFNPEFEDLDDHIHSSETINHEEGNASDEILASSSNSQIKKRNKMFKDENERW